MPIPWPSSILPVKMVTTPPGFRDAYQRFQPQAILVGDTCTGELLQDDPGGLAKTLGFGIPVIPIDLPAYQRKENWGASETFYQLVRALAGPKAPAPGTKRAERAPGVRPKANLLGPTALGFRHRDDVRELTGLLAELGVDKLRFVAPVHHGDTIYAYTEVLEAGPSPDRDDAGIVVARGQA